MDAVAVLQRALRSHTALSAGDLFPCRLQDQTVMLRVTKLSPQERVCIVETDLEVARTRGTSAHTDV